MLDTLVVLSASICTLILVRPFLEQASCISKHAVYKTYAMCCPYLCVILLLSLGPCFSGLSRWLPCRSFCPPGTSTEGRTLEFVCRFLWPSFLLVSTLVTLQDLLPFRNLTKRKKTQMQNKKSSFASRRTYQSGAIGFPSQVQKTG